MLSNLLPDDVIKFLESAPTDTPLAIAAALLPDGPYWQRRANATWSTQNWPRLHGGSWRRLVAERITQDCLENLTPKTCKAAAETIRPIGEFVVSLRLHKLMESCEEEADDLLQMEIDLRALFELLPNLQVNQRNFSIRSPAPYKMYYVGFRAFVSFHLKCITYIQVSIYLRRRANSHEQF